MASSRTRAGAARGISVRAPAKINLSLRVLGTRPDGYHELRTVFQSLALHDTLTLRRSPGAFAVTSNDPECPSDASNLVWRAADALWRAAGTPGAPGGVSVRIIKRIPMAAGLGGGSSDAAAAIRALARWWRVKLPPARLRAIAATVGADVPYFLEGGTALGIERGDVLVPLVDAPPAWVVLVIPPFGVRTADAYGWFDSDRRATGDPAPGDPGDKDGNDLQGPVVARHPEVGRIVRALARAGAFHAAMSGSGSAVFGLFRSRARAAAAAKALERRGRSILITRTVDRATYARCVRPA
jgi:4-diphosphocytidyl-2-C-methyl-D-erythritol kinase